MWKFSFAAALTNNCPASMVSMCCVKWLPVTVNWADSMVSVCIVMLLPVTFGSSNWSASITPMALFGFNFVNSFAPFLFDLNKVSFFKSYENSNFVFAGVIDCTFWTTALLIMFSTDFKFDSRFTDIFISVIKSFLNDSKSAYISVNSSSGAPM